MRRRGFTLIEVMVALTLSAFVVFVAHRIFAGVVDGSKRLEDARTELDREANGRRSLAEMFGSLDVGIDGADAFVGRPTQAEFTAWGRVPEGWLERQRVVLHADEATFGAWSDVSAVEFDYLLEPGANASWVREWVSPVAAPVAVRVRIAHGSLVDTLLFIVGSRG